MEYLFRLYAKLLWQYRIYRLKYNLVKLERTTAHKAEWTLTFELCHMILSTIPRDMLEDITRGFELNREVTLHCTDLNHYQQSLVYVIDVFHANAEFRKGSPKYGSIHLTRLKYDIDSHDTTMGMLFVDSESIKSSLKLYDWLDEQLMRLMNIERLKYLDEGDLSYIDRVSFPVLQDMFTLCTALAQIAIDRDPPTDMS